MDIKQKKNLAKSLFLNTDYTQKQICEEAQIGSDKTLRSWIDKYEWELIKESQSITPEVLRKEAYAQLNAINKEIRDNHNCVPTKQLSDAKAIVIKEIEILCKYPIHQYISVMDDFTVYLSKNKPTQLKDTVNLMNEFIEVLATKGGIS